MLGPTGRSRPAIAAWACSTSFSVTAALIALPSAAFRARFGERGGNVAGTVSLPEELKAFVDEQVSSRGYTSSSEYMRELIRRERDREKLRGLLLEGLESPLSGVVADKAYFDGLRARVREWAAQEAEPAPSVQEALPTAYKSQRSRKR